MSEFWRIYRLVLARRWMIIGLVLIALITVVIAKRVSQDQTLYTATAMVLPSQKAMAYGGVFKDSGNGVLSPTYDRNSRLALFTESIKNRQDDALGLASQSARDQKRAIVQALSGQLDPLSRARVLKPTVSDADLDAVLKLFKVPTDPTIWAPRTITPEIQLQIRNNLDVSPYYENAVNATPGGQNPTPTMTDDIQINVHSSSPFLAEQVSTLMAASFVNWYHDAGKEEYNDSVARFRESQQQTKIALDKAQDALVDFEKRTGLVNLPAQSTAEVTDLQTLRQQRDTAEAQLSSASASAASLKSQLATAPRQNITELDSQSRPEVQALQSKITSEQADLQAMAVRYTTANPQYIHAQAQLNADQDALKSLLQKPYTVASVNPEYGQLQAQAHAAENQAAGAAATLKTLDAQIQALEASNSTTLPEAKKQLNALENAVSSAQRNKTAADAAYSSLFQANKALDAGLITLTNAATYATPDTSGPGLATLLVYATLLSLVIGIGVTVGLDALDNRIQTIDDAEKLLGMSISAVIPAMPPGDPKKMTRMIVSDPLSPVAEAYRLLRTDLLFTAEDKPFKSLMGATAKPGQGATTTICNLAVALAQVGKRVILIDADLRRPKLHDFFGVSNETGLTSLLRHECELEEALKLTDIDNLLLLPSGPLPLNPSELLASPRMRTLHERMKPHTDFILVDTPSAIAFSDSAIMASFMDAVLLVMRAQEAPRGGEMRVRELLTKARANVVGVVLNGVKPQLVDSYHYHAAYYPHITTTALPEPTNHRALPAPEDVPFGGPALPDSASNGNGYGNGNGYAHSNGYEPTLMGVRIDHAQLHRNHTTDMNGTAESGYNGAGQDWADAQTGGASANKTAVETLEDSKPAKGRFNWRSMFGTQDKN